MNYNLLNEQLKALTEDVPDEISNLANASALIYDALPDINWAGFYIVKNGALVLGPFQGKPACTKIEIGRGVCGTAVANDELQRVDNVHTFAGHIACDSASQSEIVIPLHKNGEIYGVLDIDSPLLNRFNAADEQGITQLAKTIEEKL